MLKYTVIKKGYVERKQNQNILKWSVAMKV